MAFKDITGMRFGKLYVVRRSNEYYVRPNGRKTILWECKCDCGNIVLIRGDHMKRGNTLSCGKCSNNAFEFVENYCIVTCKNGRKFYIDIDDYPFVSQYSWTFDGRGYVVSYMGRDKLSKLHRVLLGVEDPKTFVDHIDHNTANNRRKNLRACTNSQNNANRSLDRRNKTGITGVGWDKARQKWIAQIGWQGKRIFLGDFTSIDDAINARKKAENEMFSTFSYDNSITLKEDDDLLILCNQV